MMKFDGEPPQGEHVPWGPAQNAVGIQFSIRSLEVADLAVYKRLRDAQLGAEPEAFTSDSCTESAKSAQAYLPRLGTDKPEGGHFTLGAWRETQLTGAISCERDMRVKVRHVAHVVGMMVNADARRLGVGRMLLDACIHKARQAKGLEMLTLSVTSTNLPAIGLYERAGFKRYGTLANAIKLGNQYRDKDLMVLTL